MKLTDRVVNDRLAKVTSLPRATATMNGRRGEDCGYLFWRDKSRRQDSGKFGCRPTEPSRRKTVDHDKADIQPQLSRVQPMHRGLS